LLSQRGPEFKAAARARAALARRREGAYLAAVLQIYLPIAGVSLDVFALLALGTVVGVLSGIFGVGGGFLLTPFLIFIGVPPAVAVASAANQLVGASVSGAMAHWRRGNLDLQMAGILLVGGLFGSSLGVWLFALMRRLGQIDLVISLSYALLLSVLGVLMLAESVRAILRVRSASGGRRKLHQHIWLHGLPLKIRFRRSKLYISALLPLVLGFAVGMLSAVMGVGGGFVMVPAMIYILGMPTAVVPGTSLFQIIFVAAAVTVLQAVANGTVDFVLVLVLLVGGVLGAQLGSRLSMRLRAEQLRALLALIILGVAIKLCFDLAVAPDHLYSLEALEP
jgi:uncharacterized protein